MQVNGIQQHPVSSLAFHKGYSSLHLEDILFIIDKSVIKITVRIGHEITFARIAVMHLVIIPEPAAGIVAVIHGHFVQQRRHPQVTAGKYTVFKHYGIMVGIDSLL